MTTETRKERVRREFYEEIQRRIKAVKGDLSGVEVVTWEEYQRRCKEPEETYEQLKLF